MEAQLTFTSVVAIAGVLHELRLPIQCSLSEDREHVDMVYPSQFVKDLLQDSKEEFRAALLRRQLDPIVHRKIMRMLFGRTVEEP